MCHTGAGQASQACVRHKRQPLTAKMQQILRACTPLELGNASRGRMLPHACLTSFSWSGAGNRYYSSYSKLLQYMKCKVLSLVLLRTESCGLPHGMIKTGPQSRAH